MRIIKIISDGVLIEVDDDDDKSLEDATKYLRGMMENDKVVTLIGKSSAAIVRPSSISGISICDILDAIPDKSEKTNTRVVKNKEQKNEHVDIISDR